MAPASSLVYIHFDAVEGNTRQMQCKYCTKQISKKSTNLEKHIRTRHENVYKELEKEKEASKDNKRKSLPEFQDNHLFRKRPESKSHGNKIKDDDDQCDEAEDKPIPKGRFNLPNTMFVISKITSKIPPAKKAIMDKLCRLCARRSKTLHPIFRMYNGRLLNDLISILCPIQIEPGDSLPKQICDECLEIVVSANALRETSLQSDINFRSGNLPEEPIQVKEEQVDDELQLEDEQMMPGSPEFFNGSVWQCNDFNTRHQQERKQSSFSSSSEARKKVTINSKPIDRQVRQIECLLNEASSTCGKAFECDHCTERFALKASIEQHMKALHFKDLKFTQAQRHSCSLNYRVKNIYKADIETCNRILLNTCTSTQAMPDLHFCHICGKSTQSAAAMRGHIRTHEDTKDFQCTQCPANFLMKAHLERHRFMHIKNRPFSCDKCGNTFKDESSLRIHGLSVHDKIRSHTCEFCGKKFFTSFKLKQHLRTHTGEKPFTCKFCDMSYAQNGDLLRHLGRAHVGDSIYGCTIEGCTESFRLKSELVDHFKVHYQIEPAS